MTDHPEAPAIDSGEPPSDDALTREELAQRPEFRQELLIAGDDVIRRTLVAIVELLSRMSGVADTLASVEAVATAVAALSEGVPGVDGFQPRVELELRRLREHRRLLARIALTAWKGLEATREQLPGLVVTDRALLEKAVELVAGVDVQDVELVADEIEKRRLDLTAEVVDLAVDRTREVAAAC